MNSQYLDAYDRRLPWAGHTHRMQFVHQNIFEAEVTGRRSVKRSTKIWGDALGEVRTEL